MRQVNIKNITIGGGRPKICVPLVGRTQEELWQQLDEILKASGGGEAYPDKRIDIVEFRADFFQDLNDESVLRQVLEKLQSRLEDKVLLFTVRSENEGGEHLGFVGPTINEINKFVIENNLADMVDVELFSGEEEVRKLCALAKSKNVKIIMSNHDFKTTPPEREIVRRLEMMESFGADIAKIAVMPEDKRQLVHLLDATLIMQERDVDTPIVTMSMGKTGALSRITGGIFGSAITFASVGKASAPGQIPYDTMGRVLQIIDDYCVEY
jgi:3-dehydroquinate dehydratase-1